MERVTFATSSGLLWVALAIHFTAGLVSIVTGAIALSVAKGGRLHKQSGMVFTGAMVVLGLTAAAVGTYEQNPSQVFSGLIAAYLVFSAMTTVKPFPAAGEGTGVKATRCYGGDAAVHPAHILRDGRIARFAVA